VIGRRPSLLSVAVHPALLLAMLLAWFPALAALTPAAAQEATPVAVESVDLSGIAPAVFDDAMQAEIDAYATWLAERYGIVGASVAITRGGETVFSRGYGVRELGGVHPVEPDTRFMIGSVTKSMTSMLAATVVDDGFASWDTPLADLIPGFALTDPALASRVTLADSFCACTGLPRDDFPLILNPANSPADELARMADISIVAPFGEEFHYSNQMYAAGGYAAALAAGADADTLRRDFDLAMQTRVLNPIGMTDSAIDLETVLASQNYAIPHGANIMGETVTISLLQEDHFVGEIAPAGAVWSTAPDMARYLATQLNDGIAPDGTRVVSPENLARTREPRIGIEIPADVGLPPSIGDAFGAYAMGWLTGSWHGLTLLSHSGGTLGFSSEVAMLPDAGAGIVILTNGGLNAGAFTLAVQYRFFELLYGLDPETGPLLDMQVAAGREAIAGIAAGLVPADGEALAPFAGRYEHPTLGIVRLITDGDAAVLAAGPFRSRLTPLPQALSPATGTPAPGDDLGQRYLLVDAPLASPAIVLTLAERDGARELRIDAADDRALTYVFDGIEE
jgi:CubicO group peptidase (beta-lactamase class C family)